MLNIFYNKYFTYLIKNGFFIKFINPKIFRMQIYNFPSDIYTYILIHFLDYKSLNKLKQCNKQLYYKYINSKSLFKNNTTIYFLNKDLIVLYLRDQLLFYFDGLSLLNLPFLEYKIRIRFDLFDYTLFDYTLFENLKPFIKFSNLIIDNIRFVITTIKLLNLFTIKTIYIFILIVIKIILNIIFLERKVNVYLDL